MPTRPASPCRQPGCPALVQGGGYCSEHKKQEQHKYDEQRGSAASRGYGAIWRKIRLIKLRESPLCEDCLKENRLTPANEVHHIKALIDGGNHSLDNLMSLCKACHSTRTTKENGGFGN
jgi:5-methylcytosine-specific restriction protein A